MDVNTDTHTELLHLKKGHEFYEMNFEFKWKQPATKMSSEIDVFQKILNKSLQKHLLACISSEHLF